jgi:lambda repressor-like predicted transcriptional regulator
MTPEDQQRAGRAVAARIDELGTNVAAIARRAQVDPKTVRALINGTRWPTYASRARINHALDWPPGEIGRRAFEVPDAFRGIPSTVLLSELCRRAEADESSKAREAGSG